MIDMTIFTSKPSRAMLCTSITVLLAACGGGSGSDTAQSDTQTLASRTYKTGWTQCAVEGSTCSFSGTQQVRYGLNGTYFYKTATSSIQCTNQVFGDPLPGADKVCAYAPTTTTTSTTTTTTTPTTTTTTTPTTTTTTTPTATTAAAAGPTITTFTPSGPITLSSGQTITGLSISNPNGACIQGSGVSNVHIYNNKIGPCGTGSDGVGIVIQNNAHDITVDHNSFDDVASGLYAVSSTNNIIFDHNYASRIRGPSPRGQMVQFNGVNGSGNKITCNVSDQTSPGYMAGTEDQINLYKSSGTAASPILISYNKLRGGGPSNSGGGIMAGDEGSSYTTVDTNILVNPGQYGLAIAGGHDNKLLNNQVYSAAFAWTNIGAYVWNQYAPTAYSDTVSGNRVNWKNSAGAANNWWDGGNSGTITMSNNVFGDSSIGTSIWDQTFTQCGG